MSLTDIKNSIKDRILKLSGRVTQAGGSDMDIEEEVKVILYFGTQLSLLTPDVNKCMETLLDALFIVQKCYSAPKHNAPDLVHTSCAGRPSFLIPNETIVYLIKNRFTVKQIATVLCVSEKTIKNRMKEYGLTISQTYATVNDEQLDMLVKSVTEEFPNIGHKFISGHLAAKGYRVQQERLMQSVRRIDPIGVLVRNLFFRSHRIKRRQYNVPAPMALWHVDSYHKLIRWRFVVHGGIDGYSRLPMYLYVAGDNTAITALEGFMKGIQEYGIPQRVRTDKGGENVEIAKFMLQNRGLRRGSIITGRSVHNQRIERFWREVWHGCTNTYYQLFQYLEAHNLLDPDCEVDLYSLHMVFLERIQNSLSKFTASVARRPIRTEGNRIPLELWISGQALDNIVELLTQEDVEYFGIDCEGLPEYGPESRVVVPSLITIGEELKSHVAAIIAQNTNNDPYEFGTYMLIKDYLVELLT